MTARFLTSTGIGALLLAASVARLYLSSAPAALHVTSVSGAALAAAGIAPLTLAAKEGLALINGTQYMLALGALALTDAEALVDVADIAGAMSLEAQKGSSRPFDERVVGTRPHPGALATAALLRALISANMPM